MGGRKSAPGGNAKRRRQQDHQRERVLLFDSTLGQNAGEEMLMMEIG